MYHIQFVESKHLQIFEFFTFLDSRIIFVSWYMSSYATLIASSKRTIAPPFALISRSADFRERKARFACPFSYLFLAPTHYPDQQKIDASPFFHYRDILDLVCWSVPGPHLWSPSLNCVETWLQPLPLLNCRA